MTTGIGAAGNRANDLVVRSNLGGGDLTRRSQNELISGIEKLVTDVRRGTPEFSRGVLVELSERSSETSSILAHSNPQAASLYQGVSTFLTYGQKARFVSAVHTAAVHSFSKLV